MFTKSKIQGFLINAAIVIAVMAIVQRVKVLRELVFGK